MRHALTIAYGQRHAIEVTAARRVAAALGAIEHRVLNLDLRAFGGSALTEVQRQSRVLDYFTCRLKIEQETQK